MYKFIIALLLCGSIASSASAQSDAISKHFKKYVDDDRFTVVYVSQRMFSMFADMNIKDMAEEGEAEAKAALAMLEELRGLRILTTETTPNLFYDNAVSIINESEYELLMQVRGEGGENVQFHVRDNKSGGIEELLLLVGGDEFVLLSIEGNIDLKKIGKLAATMNIKGTEHLKELEKR